MTLQQTAVAADTLKQMGTKKDLTISAPQPLHL